LIFLTGSTGLSGFLFVRHFPEESGETQSRPPGGKILNIVNCPKQLFLNQLQLSGNCFSTKAIEFFGFHPESQKEKSLNPVNHV
jgi:hypothetical protein